MYAYRHTSMQKGKLFEICDSFGLAKLLNLPTATALSMTIIYFSADVYFCSDCFAVLFFLHAYSFN